MCQPPTNTSADNKKLKKLKRKLLLTVSVPEVDGGKRIQMKDEVKIINVGKWRKRYYAEEKKYFPPKLPSRQERENTVTPQPFLHSRQETNFSSAHSTYMRF